MTPGARRKVAGLVSGHSVLQSRLLESALTDAFRLAASAHSGEAVDAAPSSVVAARAFAVVAASAVGVAVPSAVAVAPFAVAG